MTVPDDLLDDSIRHQVFIQRVRTQEANKVVGLLNTEVIPELDAEIAKRLRETMTPRQLRKLDVITKRKITKTIKKVIKAFSLSMDELAVSEGASTIRILEASNPIGLRFNHPGNAILKTLASKSKPLGRSVEKWIGDVAANTQQRVVEQLTQGLAEGESIPRMMRRLRGTRAAQFTDGVYGATRREAATIVRTVATDITNRARSAVFKANDDIIKGVQYIATLDSRTTPICSSLDGRVFKVGEGPRPPQHHQCRSTTVPVLKSFEELGITIKAKPPIGTRASAGFSVTRQTKLGRQRLRDIKKGNIKDLRGQLNGQVPAKLTYGDWLKKQPHFVQNEALGVGKADLFRRGKVPIRRFTDRKGDPLTLKQLERLETKAASEVSKLRSIPRSGEITSLTLQSSN